MVIFHSYVKLLEGTCKSPYQTRWSLRIACAETLWKCSQMGVRSRLNMHEITDPTRKPMCLYVLPDSSFPCRGHRDKWRKDNGNLLEHHLGDKAHAQDLQVGTSNGPVLNWVFWGAVGTTEKCCFSSSHPDDLGIQTNIQPLHWCL